MATILIVVLGGLVFLLVAGLMQTSRFIRIRPLARTAPSILVVTTAICTLFGRPGRNAGTFRPPARFFPTLLSPRTGRFILAVMIAIYMRWTLRETSSGGLTRAGR